MRDLHTLDMHRLTDANTIAVYGWAGDETCGVFAMPSPHDRGRLLVVASAELGWDHVSVSAAKRVPNYKEMTYVKKRFFRDDEIAVEYHVPEDAHINMASNCLHLWRPNDGREIPLPPGWMVGIKGVTLK
jgi:hypothetical protein